MVLSASRKVSEDPRCWNEFAIVFEVLQFSGISLLAGLFSVAIWLLGAGVLSATTTGDDSQLSISSVLAYKSLESSDRGLEAPDSQRLWPEYGSLEDLRESQGGLSRCWWVSTSVCGVFSDMLWALHPASLASGCLPAKTR